MSDVITTTTAATPAEAKPKRADKAFTVETIARARLRARKVNATDDRVRDEMKVVRGMLRRSFPALAKAAPASYGPKGKVKTTHNDRRPWGPIPASVAKTILK